MSENIIATINQKKYDHVFRIVFNNKKELLSLYNALANRDYNDPDALQINTLEDAVFIGMKNDISFIISDYLNLYEHQSTINNNMPLRGLFYFSDLYKSMYYNRALYDTKQINILTPIFVVFYNGTVDIPDNYTMKLSEAFINPTDSPDLEVIAHVYNINYGHNINLYKKCKKLEEYSIFVDKVHKALANADKQDYAKELARVIDDCIKNDILADILIRERSRIMESFLSHFDADEYVDFIKQDSYEDGIKQGVSQGTDNATIKNLKNTMKNGSLSFDAACDLLGIDNREKYRNKV